MLGTRAVDASLARRYDPNRVSHLLREMREQPVALRERFRHLRYEGRAALTARAERAKRAGRVVFAGIGAVAGVFPAGTRSGE